MSYEKIIKFTLKYEGGLSDHPNDKGGLTKYGVSLAAGKNIDDDTIDMDGDSQITSYDIRNLTLEASIEWYKNNFWNIPYHLDEIESEWKQFIIFDCNVNHGPRNTTKLIQSTLRDMNYNITIDGIYGKNTKTALIDSDSEKFFTIMLRKRENFYKAIVNKNPSQHVFLKGWLNRINMIKKDVNELRK